MVLARLAESEGSSHERGGTVSEEARTGKRFPLELPIKIHKESAERRRERNHGKFERGGSLYPRRCVAGDWVASGI